MQDQASCDCWLTMIKVRTPFSNDILQTRTCSLDGYILELNSQVLTYHPLHIVLSMCQIHLPDCKVSLLQFNKYQPYLLYQPWIVYKLSTHTRIIIG